MLRLKTLLSTLHLPQKRLAVACGISTAAAAQLVNNDRWPVKGSREVLQARIVEFLQAHGATAMQRARAFEVVPDVSKQPEEQLCSKSSDFHRLFLWISWRPSDAGFEDGVDDGQQFSHACDQRDLGRFTGSFQALVERTDGRIESHSA